MREETRAVPENSATLGNTEEDSRSAMIANLALGLDREYPVNDADTQSQMEACQQACEELCGMIPRQTTYGIAPEARM